jgi:hypothetical protein
VENGEERGGGGGGGGGSSNDSGTSAQLLFQALFFFSDLLFFMTFNDLTKINYTRRKSVRYVRVNGEIEGVSIIFGSVAKRPEYPTKEENSLCE